MPYQTKTHKTIDILVTSTRIELLVTVFVEKLTIEQTSMKDCYTHTDQNNVWNITTMLS